MKTLFLSEVLSLAQVVAGGFMGVVVAADSRAAMDTDTVVAGLASHDRALHIKDGWIRDPYIVLGPDGFYYLTGTTPNPGPEEAQEFERSAVEE